MIKLTIKVLIIFKIFVAVLVRTHEGSEFQIIIAEMAENKLELNS